MTDPSINLQNRGRKFRITSCTNSLMWYSTRIGEEFVCLWEDPLGAWTREGTDWNPTNWVYTQDLQWLDKEAK